MQQGKKILIITYYWPPSGGVGVQRWMHFAINLKKLGFDPKVYTPSNPQFELKDEQLLDLVKDIPVIKKPIWEPFGIFHRLTGNRNRGKVKQGLALEKQKKSLLDQLIIWLRGNVLIPDARKFWRKPSVRFLKDRLNEERFDWMVTTGPPHSIHLIGRDLKKQHPSIKWLADFRDPWSEWDVLDKLSTGRRARNLHRRWEQQVVRQADLISATTPSMAGGFQKNAQRQVAVISNGTDRSFAGLPPGDSARKDFKIGYYGLLNELRDPQGLWQALSALLTNDPAFRESFYLELGGTISDSITSSLHAMPAYHGKIVEVGYLSQNEVFQAYASCRLLLLLLSNTETGKVIVPQKFFEYLTVGVPILAIGPEGSEVEDAMKDANIGEYFRSDDVSGMKEFISRVFAGKYTYTSSDAEHLLNAYSRESQAKKLADLLISFK